jgi:hypothetical protein
MKFNDYYRHYLSLHQNRICRRLHLAGLVFAIGLAAAALATSHWGLALACPLTVYPFAWLGHFMFERNTPATWTNPLLAGLADLRMTWDMMSGRLSR